MTDIVEVWQEHRIDYRRIYRGRDREKAAYVALQARTDRPGKHVIVQFADVPEPRKPSRAR